MFSIKNAFDVYQKTKSLGEKSINSEYMFVIDGEPDVTYLSGCAVKLCRSRRRYKARTAKQS
ncbi:hypothetical protein JF634_12085 [Simonsiella muelleri]|uniref:Uncharacterized protein n=1 Tax=Simonsiella muelleri ATCC 29453 TaxID=641147 RepID=U6Q274_9NEIS|nr:hypothetical protein [Simonsiella muelleri]AUX61789.1 hypothetical protein BWP33_08235 [Simonsiella muelleri ATCC 29453]EJZ50200.1 hypothetical protein HMPREF9021_02557 [Simonsiella muelleri ATCC 29453]UBQ53870.1 hypothetical protein JF634_12085 [Simonsiella muelleri]